MRQNLPDLLKPGAIVVELGVAKGIFSEQLLQHPNVGQFFGIDAWAGDRGHDTKEYTEASERSKQHLHAKLLRLRFDEAIKQFEDEYFDLVYVDGYAHECDGSTFRDWWPKVKAGGILAGHDYSDKWPLVVKEVDKFASDHGLKVNVIPAEPGKFTFPSWYVIK